jgi:hypothetical protein
MTGSRKPNASAEVIAHGVHRRGVELLGHLPAGELELDEEIQLGLNDTGDLVAIEAIDPPRRYVLMGRPFGSVTARTRPDGPGHILVATFRNGRLLGETRHEKGSR